MDKLLKELRRIVNDGVRSGKSRDEITKELNVVFKRYDIAVDDVNAIRNKMTEQYDWLSQRIIGESEKQMAHSILSTAGEGFAKTKKGIISEVKSRVLKGLTGDATKAEIRNELEAVIGKARNYAETISRTAIAGFSQADNIVKAESSGMAKFTYVGPPAEREFCAELMSKSATGQTWTLKEIRAMDNGQGLPVELYGGGYNCRHQWVIAE